MQIDFGFIEDTGDNPSGSFVVSRNSGSLKWHNYKTGVDTTLAPQFCITKIYKWEALPPIYYDTIFQAPLFILYAKPPPEFVFLIATVTVSEVPLLR